MIKKASLLLSMFLFCSMICVAQVGQNFPMLSGKTLEDKAISFPTDAKGKFTLVGLAFSKKAEDDLQTWFLPVYSKFISKTSGPALFEVDYDVNVYFIPMFSGVNQLAAGTAVNKMKENVDKGLHPHVIVFSGKMDELKSELKLDKKEVPYFFVLNENGKIVYKTTGAFTEDKLEEVEEFLD